MKKLTQIIGIFAISFFLICLAGNVEIFATDFTSAMYIAVNSDIVGNVNKGYKYEKNIYAFSLTEDGYIDVELTYPRQNSTDAFWKTELYNSEYTLIDDAKAYGNYDHMNMTKMGLPLGDYYLVVESAYETSAKSTDFYTLNIGYTQSSSWEKELNGDFNSSTPISVNTDICGTIRSGYKYEKDYYVFNIDEDGCVDISLSYNRQGSTSSFWKVLLYNEQNQEVDQVTANGNVDKTSMTSMGVPAGDYYVVVQSSTEYSAQSNDVYTLNVGYTRSDKWEKEFNNDFNSATPVDLNTKYNGTTKSGYKYEKDFYKFELEKDGYIDVAFSNKRQGSTGNFWKLILYNEENKEVDNVTAAGNAEGLNMTTMGLTKGAYFLVVQSSSEYSAVSTDTYSFKVNFHESGKWEKEFNEDFNSATPITVNTYYNGTIKNGYKYEKDFYYVDVDDPGFYTLRFKADKQSSTSSVWQVKLYDENYKEIKSLNVAGNNTNVYVAYEFEQKRYYVKVTSCLEYSAYSTDVYSISVRKVKPSLPQVKSIKAKKTYVTLTWHKSEDVSGYEIQYSTAKNFKKGVKSVIINGNDENSAIIEDLKAGKKYYFRVRTFATYNINGSEETYYSGWSARKSAKTSK